MRPIFVLLALLCLPLIAADIDPAAEHYGKQAIVLKNGKIALTVLRQGTSLAKIVLAADPEQLNPLWDSYRSAQMQGRPIPNTGAVGQFLCVDGFGPVSDEEAEAGLQGHGEAHRLMWSLVSAKADSDGAKAVLAVTLPRVQEEVTREVSLLEGENVARFHTTLESLLAFDRPAVWAEHATIGSPFLEPAQTVVDMSPNRAMTRPRPKDSSGRAHRLVGGEEFEWPMAPTQGGGKVDLRAAPAAHDSLDHTGHLMTPSGEMAWVTALNPEKHLLIGWIYKTSEYPWMQTWENYPAEGMLARGLEFGTQAFDLPRREVITQNRLMGQLLYRWLPAQSKIESTFLVFWTPAPEGMKGVSEIKLEGGAIRIRDERGGKSLQLETRQKL